MKMHGPNWHIKYHHIFQLCSNDLFKSFLKKFLINSMHVHMAAACGAAGTTMAAPILSLHNNLLMLLCKSDHNFQNLLLSMMINKL